NPSGTPQDAYAVTVTVTDDDTGVGAGGTAVIVNNVAPTVTGLSGPASINENDTYKRTGTFHDPGTLDAHTVVITWGRGGRGQPSEGAPTLTAAYLTYRGNRAWPFPASPQHLDDTPSGTPQDAYAITVTVTDDDTGTGNAATSVTVANLAPAVDPITGP